jgi:uncharacterized membrane protein YgdD (TMEM256/DUF423 family)
MAEVIEGTGTGQVPAAGEEAPGRLKSPDHILRSRILATPTRMSLTATSRRFAALGALFAFVAVGLGAFGAHALEGRLTPGDLSTFETGVRYQTFHALALFVVAWAADRSPGPWISAAGWLFSIGIVVFAGSLYFLVLTGPRALGAVTPVGGVAFLVGWLTLAIGLRKT